MVPADHAAPARGRNKFPLGQEAWPGPAPGKTCSLAPARAFAVQASTPPREAWPRPVLASLTSSPRPASPPPLWEAETGARRQRAAQTGDEGAPQSLSSRGALPHMCGAGAHTSSPRGGHKDRRLRGGLLSTSRHWLPLRPSHAGTRRPNTRDQARSPGFFWDLHSPALPCSEGHEWGQPLVLMEGHGPKAAPTPARTPVAPPRTAGPCLARGGSPSP